MFRFRRARLSLPTCTARGTISVECRAKRVGESPLFCWVSHICKMPDTVTSKIEEIAQRVAGSEGLELVEVEVKGGGGGRLVRISIDKPEGVTHGDCELVSHQVGTILDVEDVIPGGRYTLEVSSPGVERKLLKPDDYRRFQGKKAKITLRDAVEGRRNWEGTLAGFENGDVALETQPGKTLRIPIDQVQKANLKFEW
jgi:ribosome maturation factor RimP